MWLNSTEEDLQQSLPPPEECGWKKNEDGYEFDWECPEVQRSILDTITFLTKGCGCKKGCQSQRCSCYKQKHLCGPGCQCQNCLNVPSPNVSLATSELASATSEEPSDSEDEGDTSGFSSESEEENIQTEIISDIL